MRVPRFLVVPGLSVSPICDLPPSRSSIVDSHIWACWSYHTDSLWEELIVPAL